MIREILVMDLDWYSVVFSEHPAFRFDLNHEAGEGHLERSKEFAKDYSKKMQVPWRICE